MQRRTIECYLLLILCACLLGCSSSTPSSTPPQATLKWAVYDPGDGKFTVDLPGKHELYHTEYHDKSLNLQLHVQHVFCDTGDLKFEISYQDFPRELTDDQIEAQLSGGADQISQEADQFSQERIEVQGHPAMETKTEIKGMQAQSVGRFVFVDKKRFYSMQVFSVKGKPPRDIADRFFDSFRLGAID